MKERAESQQTVDGGTESISSRLGLFNFQAPRADHGWRHAPSLLAVLSTHSGCDEVGDTKKHISKMKNVNYKNSKIMNFNRLPFV